MAEEEESKSATKKEKGRAVASLSRQETSSPVSTSVTSPILMSAPVMEKQLDAAGDISALNHSRTKNS